MSYTDAVAFGGAEECLGTVLAGLPPEVEVSVVGVTGVVVDRIAARRPGATTTVVRAPSSDWDVRSLLEHRRAFRRLRPDVVHVNMRMPLACRDGLIAALLTPGAKVVAVEHLPMDVGRRTQRWVKRAISRRLDAHVAVGLEAARQIEDHARLPRGSVRMIHNGVPLAAPTDPPRFASGPTVGAIGRFDRQKGFDVLVRALADAPGVTLVVVGDGPERVAIEELGASLGLGERLVLPGWVDEARALLPAFDVFALSSRFEGFPLVVLEAMQAGVPVVATRVGGVPEMVTEETTGLLVPPDDPPALARALRRLLDDDELRLRLAAAAREVATTQFEAGAMARAYEALYRDSIGGRRTTLRLAAYTDATVWGGAEECLASIISGLGPTVDVVVLGVTDSIVCEIASRRPGSVTRVLPRVRGAWDITRLWALSRAIRACRADVCHVNLRAPYLCQHAEVAGLLSRRPVVALEHSVLPEFSRLRHTVKRVTSRRLAAHVAPSDASARWIEHAASLSPGSVRTIHNGVWARAAARVTVPAPGPIVGSIGRIEQEKGYDVLVDALAELPTVTAVLVGAGSKGPELRRRAVAAGVGDRLVLTGWVEDARAYIPGFDVFVLPSRTEGFPLTILEAMQAGVPVVATDVGGVGEAVVDGVSGFLVPPDDPQALAEAIRVLLGDDDARERFRAEGRRLASTDFEASRMAREYEHLYRRVAAAERDR